MPIDVCPYQGWKQSNHAFFCDISRAHSAQRGLRDSNRLAISCIKKYLDDNSSCALLVTSYRVGRFSCWFLGSCDNSGRELAAILLWCGHLCVEVHSSDFSHKICTIAFCCFFSTAYKDGRFSRMFSSSKSYNIGVKASYFFAYNTMGFREKFLRT